MKMSNNIIAAVLVVLTIGTTGYAVAGKHMRGERADYAVGFIAKKLNLDTTQEQALEALKDQMLVAKQTMRGDMEQTKADARSLIESETFDQAKALDLVTNKTSNVNAVAPELVAALGHFLDTLDAEQKAEIIEFMDSHKGRHGRWRH